MALLRCLPYGLSTVAANVLHYSSLWAAKKAASRRLKARQRLLPQTNGSEHLPLTYDLMGSPEMRRARYKIKLVRYTITLLHLLLFYNRLEELHLGKFRCCDLVSFQALITGLLTGLLAIYLNENCCWQMRTPWRPAHDFKSRKLGIAWDFLRVAGGCLAIPVEEELFYHSWLYRQLLKLSHHGYRNFLEVPFWRWNWLCCLAANGFFALHNGMEWRSCLLGGVLFQWVIASGGQFLDGLLAHVICNLTISAWVLFTGQRQYW